MEKTQWSSWAEKLHQARLRAKPISQISTQISHSLFQREDAYAIQEEGMALRRDEGELCLGLKMGLTSETKRRQMDLDSPLYGELADKMQLENGGHYSLKGRIHPKVEPEIAFLIGAQLPQAPRHQEVLEAITEIYPCLEILDSRYSQFKYFSMEDVIADNSSSSHFVLGDPIKNFRHLDLKALFLEMKINGEVAAQGWTSAISGDPVVSVIQLCELLAQRQRSLPVGSLVLAGAATLAVALEPGQKIELEGGDLGTASFLVEK